MSVKVTKCARAACRRYSITRQRDIGLHDRGIFDYKTERYWITRQEITRCHRRYSITRQRDYKTVASVTKCAIVL